MIYVLYFLYVIVCLFLIAVVLLQQGKGADLAGAFGVGQGTQAAFGARGATTLLHKLTTWAFVGFIVLSLAISVKQARDNSGSVIGSDAANAKPRAASTAATAAAPAPMPVPTTGIAAPVAPPAPASTAR